MWPERRVSLAILLLAVGLSALAACGDDGPEPPTSPEIVEVEVTPSSATLDAVGDTGDFDATARDASGSAVPGASFEWSVSPDSVARVDDDGTVTAEAPGSAAVEARTSGVTGSADLSVDQEVAQLEVSPDSVSFEAVGDTQRFEAEARDENDNPISDPVLEWFSSDTSVARVDGTGLATAVGGGEARIRAAAAAGDVSDTSEVSVPRQRIDGAAGDPVNEHIPDVPFPTPDSADYTLTDDSMRISRRNVAVLFTDETTVGEANDLLGQIQARIIGGNPTSHLLFLEVPDQSLEQATRMSDSLNADPRIRNAALDALLERKAPRLPPHQARPSWRWDRSNSGNWGLQAIRAPQMWNLNRLAERVDRTACAIVVEPGNFPDTNHPDVQWQAGTINASDEHATHVAGTIGARWANQAGVEGVDPWLEWIRVFVTPSRTRTDDIIARGLKALPCAKVVNMSAGVSGTSAHSGQLNDMARNLRLSLADMIEATGRRDFFLVGAAGNDGQTNAAKWQSGICRNADLGFPRYYCVEAANTNNQRMTNAAVPGFTASRTVGTVSAPGMCIRSTEANDGNAYSDAGVCPASTIDQGASNDQWYGTVGATSMATPHVSGLIAALFQLAPSAPSPTEMRRLVTDGSVTANLTSAGNPKAGAPRIDAFAAAMELDSMFGDPARQRALVNVDHGTEDGNLRVNPFSGETLGQVDRPGPGGVTMRDFRTFRDAYAQLNGGLAGTPDVALDGPADHVAKDLNRDGCVGNQSTQPALHGGVNCTKNGIQYGEGVFPRYDFNGNGRIHQGGSRAAGGGAVPNAALAPFKIDPDQNCNAVTNAGSADGCKRDVDVMREVWSDDEVQDVQAENVRTDVGDQPSAREPPAGWTPTRLLEDRDGDDRIDYLLSFDLAVDVAAADTLLQPNHFELLHFQNPPGDIDTPGNWFPTDTAAVLTPNGLTVRSLGGSFVKSRMAERLGTVTVPLPDDLGRVIYGKKEELQAGGADNRFLALRFSGPGWAEDFSLTSSWDTLHVGSTSRDDILEALPPRKQIEVIFRGVPNMSDDPNDQAYFTSSCLSAESPEHRGTELHQTMQQKAEELWLQQQEVDVPPSRLKAWIEGEGGQVELVDPVVQRYSTEGCERGSVRAKLWGAWIRGTG